VETEVLSGFTLTSKMYELVAAKLHELKVPVDYTYERFTDKMFWKKIPDPNAPKGTFFKVEQNVFSGPPYKRAIRVNGWYAADVRVNGIYLPHNHPWWPVNAHILTGGYRQRAYEVVGVELDDMSETQLQPSNIRHLGLQDLRAGDVNHMSHLFFHEVEKVFKPGKTISVMDCGKSVKDGWGYLDLKALTYKNCKAYPLDAAHKANVRALNPHLFA
jgi:hypothetical protein